MRLAAAACVVLALPACATLENMGDGTRPGDRSLWLAGRPTNAMQVFQMRALTAASRTSGEEYERGRAEIDWRNGRVFVGTSDRGMYALRAGNLTTIWRFETLGVVQSEPLYDPELDFVYFGSHDGALYCVRAGDGSLVWRFNSGAEVARQPVREGERLFFANAADNLFAVDRRTGKTLWTQHRTPALGMEIGGYAGPALDAGVVFQAYSDGVVQAYRTVDGSEAWGAPVDLAAEAEREPGDQQRYLDVDTTPVVDTVEIPHEGRAPEAERVLFVASYAGGVFTLDAQTGAIVGRNDKAVGVTELSMWSEPAHAPNPDGPLRGTGTVPARKLLLAASASTGIWALDPNSATLRDIWRHTVPEGGITVPVPVAGALLLGSTRYGMFLMSPLNGKVIDGFDLGSGFAHTPAVFGHRAYVMSNAGTLIAMQIEPPVVRTAKDAAKTAAR